MNTKFYLRYILAVLLVVVLTQNATANFIELTEPLLTDTAQSMAISNESDGEQISLISSSCCSAAVEGCVPSGGCQEATNSCANFGEWWKFDPSRNFAFGLNGAAGDSETLDLVFGFDSKRDWGLHSMLTDLDYFYSRADVATTKNRLYSLSRYERAIQDTPYSLFVDAWFEYDQFKSYDVRIASHAGLIRTCIKTDVQLLRVLAGLGAARTFGGLDDDWKAEPEFGALYELKINKMQKLLIQALYYPEIVDPSLFRLNIKASWEVRISEVRDIAFRISAFNRYDNTDLSLDNPNAIDYAMSIVWGF